MSSGSSYSSRLWPRDQMQERAKWRAIIDNGLRSMCLGLVCAGGASMLAFRSITPRIALTTFGTGVGLGASYVDAKYILGHDVSVIRAWRADVRQHSDDDSRFGSAEQQQKQ